jgi:FERM N-terminal domain.
MSIYVLSYSTYKLPNYQNYLFQPHYKGKYLLDHVCSQLNLIEVDYFGLRFTDSHKIRVSIELIFICYTSVNTYTYPL